ncbi:MAG: rRNA maturation RNase YbeY [Myxococcales bacterium]
MGRTAAAQNRAAVRLSVEVRRGAHAARILRAAARHQLAALDLSRELSLTLVSDRRMRTLNRDWRGKDRETDVLSFPQHGASIGDVVISLDTARRQAREGGWSLAAELRRLLAHGLLHCLGHDHHTPADARRMAAAEERLLGRRGMVGESSMARKR